MNNNYETQPDKEPIVNNGQLVVNELIQEIQIIDPFFQDKQIKPPIEVA